MDTSVTHTDLETPAAGAEAAAEEDPRAQLEQRFRNGASWFYWVAVLSLVNSVVALFDGEWGFIFGLGVTQVVDAFALAVAEESADLAMAGRIASLGVNLFIIGVVALMGWLAHKRMQWVFVLGLVLYVGDALLFLLVGDFLSLAFHGWVLFAVTSGLVACRRLKAMDASAGPRLDGEGDPAVCHRK